MSLTLTPGLRLNSTTLEVGDKFSQDFAENISTISAGVTKLKILEET